MDYSKFANIANNLLGGGFGTTATLTHKVSGTYDPNTSEAPVTSVADTVNVVIAPYDADLIDGTFIHVGDLQVIMGTEGVTSDPQAGDNVTVGAKTFKVIKAKTHQPVGQAVLHELQVRK